MVTGLGERSSSHTASQCLTRRPRASRLALASLLLLLVNYLIEGDISSGFSSIVPLNLFSANRGSRAHPFQNKIRRHSAATAEKPKVVNAEDIDVWDQSVEELSLDVRELLITDGNIFFIGPDIESYRDAIEDVARRINYTAEEFSHPDLMSGCKTVPTLERVFWVPPLLSIQRWPWTIFKNGLVVWIDPDDNPKWHNEERDRILNLKFPKKKQLFGPEKPTEFTFNKPNEIPPGDPVDMWMEADVQVNLKKRADLPATNAILASIIDAILKSPPKWRGWMKAAKVRGSVPSDYESPLQARRAFHSYGVSPRLNKLLKA